MPRGGSEPRLGVWFGAQIVVQALGLARIWVDSIRALVVPNGCSTAVISRKRNTAHIDFYRVFGPNVALKRRLCL